MKIETKFNVHDLVQRKFDTELEDGKKGFEILEIVIQVCYAGVQVSYLCRPLLAFKKTNGYGPDKKTYWEVSHGLSKESNGQMGWEKYREDELIEMEKEAFDVITGGIK